MRTANRWPGKRFSRHGRTSVDFTANQRGQFTASVLVAGKATLTLTPDPQRYTWDPPAPQAIEIPAKEAIAVQVTRLPMITISGRVVDEQQHPRPG